LAGGQPEQGVPGAPAVRGNVAAAKLVGELLAGKAKAQGSSAWCSIAAGICITDE